MRSSHVVDTYTYHTVVVRHAGDDHSIYTIVSNLGPPRCLGWLTIWPTVVGQKAGVSLVHDSVPDQNPDNMMGIGALRQLIIDFILLQAMQQ